MQVFLVLRSIVCDRDAVMLCFVGYLWDLLDLYFREFGEIVGNIFLILGFIDPIAPICTGFWSQPRASAFIYRPHTFI